MTKAVTRNMQYAICRKIFNKTDLKRSLQRSFLVSNWRVGLILALALLGVALVGGGLIVLVHPALAVALPLALAIGLLMLRTPQWGLYGTIAVAVLLVIILMHRRVVSKGRLVTAFGRKINIMETYVVHILRVHKNLK